MMIDEVISTARQTSAQEIEQMPDSQLAIVHAWAELLIKNGLTQLAERQHAINLGSGWPQWAENPMRQVSIGTDLTLWYDEDGQSQKLTLEDPALADDDGIGRSELISRLIANYYQTLFVEESSKAP